MGAFHDPLERRPIPPGQFFFHHSQARLQRVFGGKARQRDTE
jgi:hypothetical protein